MALITCSFDLLSGLLYLFDLYRHTAYLTQLSTTMDDFTAEADPHSHLPGHMEDHLLTLTVPIR